MILSYVTFGVRFDDALVENVPLVALRADWTDEPPPPSTQAMGDVWLKEKRCAVLELPSVIIPGETNYLFNPAHPDFKKIVIGQPQSFSLDRRLLS